MTRKPNDYGDDWVINTLAAGIVLAWVIIIILAVKWAMEVAK